MIDTQPSALWEDAERLRAIAELSERIVREFEGKRWPNLFKCYWWASQIYQICTRRRSYLEKHRAEILDCLNDI